MARDIVYIYDKNSKARIEFGEIQSDFNMSFVIDGTKDSCSILVFSWQEQEIEPYTILKHVKTNTWWVVSHDKVERYQNEDGFVYLHNLDLLGCVELLNARELVDCGFNDNTYNVNEFITRLFNLSNFEYSIAFASSTDLNFLGKNVDFIKTFENYTLLSALREFLDAYNMSLKLSFVETTIQTTTYISYARIHIIPKTGDFTLTTHNIDDFDLVKETKTMDKNSFGACVVSNAENVISSDDTTFPSTSTVKLSSKTFKIEPRNAIIRLPSKVFMGNWIKLSSRQAPCKIEGYLGGATLSYDATINPYIEDFDAMFSSTIDLIKNVENAEYQGQDVIHSDFYDALYDDRERVMDYIKKASTITLYNGNKIGANFGSSNTQTGTPTIEQGENVPYLAKLSMPAHGVERNKCVFCDKETIDLLPKTYQGIAWERGSNIISGFEMFGTTETNRNIAVVDDSGNPSQNNMYMNTDLQILIDYDNPPVIFNYSNQYGSISITLKNQYTISFLQCQWIVNYIPMGDIKIKVDNQRDKKDIQLYNQNGRLTDSIALSKLLNSYSKEISSDTITRYMNYTNLDLVPKVGSFVYDNNISYVINNVSMTFTQNETKLNNSFNYFIECEFTMSKYVTTKSLMVNPNTNIRDYGIPQNYNVKRKQLYRDYYELDYAKNSDVDNEFYLPLENTFNFSHNFNEKIKFVGIIKTTYNDLVEGSYNWYYQLDTTTYYMNKMVYSVLDLQDNNIIGYGSQNVFSGFVIARILSGLTDVLNTPVTYTDNDGKVKDFDILLCTTTQIVENYKNYIVDSGISSGWNSTLYNYSTFIPQEIYDYALNDYTIRINDINYNKDALEVPVFEYACQVDDSENIFIGDNILMQHENCIYFYSFVMGDNLTQDNCVDTNEVVQVANTNRLEITNGVEIEFYNQYDDTFRFRFYDLQTYDKSNGEFTNSLQKNITLGKDYAIFRHSYNLETNVDTIELMLIAKKVPGTNVLNNNLLTIFINHYKLN